MANSHIADDYAAIARRLKEIETESQTVGRPAPIDVRPPVMGDLPDWTERQQNGRYRMQAGPTRQGR
jgi:hypothetical protein